MKHLFKKFSNDRSSLVARVKMGRATFDIIESDNQMKGLYKGTDIISFPMLKHEDEQYDKTLGDLIKVIAGDKHVCIQTSQKVSLITRTASHLKKSYAIPVVLKALPANVSPETPDMDMTRIVSYEALVESLKQFRVGIMSLCGVLLSLRNTVLMLTRGKIVDTMWGAKIVQKALDTVRYNITNDVKISRIELIKEMIDRSIDRLTCKIQTNLAQVCSEEKSVIGGILIPNIIGNYEDLKCALMRMVISVGGLVYIDDLFMQSTNYPARFFMDISLLDGMRQDYTALLNFMAQIPETEETVINPLDIMRMQFSNVT